MAQPSDDVLKRATGRDSPGDAIAWIAEGHPLEEEVELQRLLRELASRNGSEPTTNKAIQRIVRQATRSEVDPARLLFRVGEVSTPDQFRRALDTLAWKAGGSIALLEPVSLRAAQRECDDCIRTLCAVAALTYNNLCERATTSLPNNPEGDWSPSQIGAAYEVFDEVLASASDPDLPGAAAMRPIEHLAANTFGRDHLDGWELVEQLRCGGVPYEVLLAQREAGGAWTRHRSRFSGSLSERIADKLCEKLDEENITYLRSKDVGGNSSRTDLQSLTGAGGSIGLVVMDDGEPVCAVGFSSAKDGGTARKNVGRLETLGNASIPVAVVVAGPGWAQRNETAELAKAVDGAVYPESQLDSLFTFIQRLLR